MYQVISQEMLNMLAGAAAFNNLIGEPVYKYRQSYKSLEKLRHRFFSKVENDIDFEKVCGVLQVDRCIISISLRKASTSYFQHEYWNAGRCRKSRL